MAEVAAKGLELAIPTEAYGFAVSIEIGPWPANFRRSHRRGIYAKLRPITETTRAAMAAAGNAEIVSGAELERDTARALQENPQSILESEREELAKNVLGPALALARKVARAATS